MSAMLLALAMAVSQPGPGGPPPAAPALAPAVTLDPRTAVAAIRAAYTTGPTAERLTIIVRKADRVVGRGQVLVRLDPGRGEGHPDATLSIEATPLRIWAGRGVVNVILAANPDTVCSMTFEGPLTTGALAGVLPPTPAPSLGLLRADREVAPADLVPWLSHASWTGAELITQPEPSVLRLTGDGASGSIRVEADGRSGRLRGIWVNRPDGVSVDVAVAPADVPPPPDWPATAASRLRVEAIGDLPRRPGELVTGRVLPEPLITRESGTGVKAADACGPRGVALVALLPAGPEPADARTRDAIASIVRAATAELGEPAPGIARAAGVLSAPTDAAGWAAIPWDESDGPRGVIADAAVGRLVRSGRGGVLVVGSDRRVRGWVAVRPEVDPATIAAEIVKLVRGG